MNDDNFAARYGPRPAPTSSEAPTDVIIPEDVKPHIPGTVPWITSGLGI